MTKEDPIDELTLEERQTSPGAMNDLPMSLTIITVVALTGFTLLKMSGCLGECKNCPEHRNSSPAAAEPQ